MFSAFLALAAVSPGRQSALRRASVAHLLALSCAAWGMMGRSQHAGAAIVGQTLLIAGIVEGAILIGWRLTQIPKSQALEFLLVTPQKAAGVFLAEALVGLIRLAVVTFSGLPILVILVLAGRLAWIDLPTLLLFPFTWGGITAFGLTTWAYEPIAFRKWGERFVLVMILFYLAIGVLAGENLRAWVEILPPDAAEMFLWGFAAFHTYNPFALMQFWAEVEWPLAWERVTGVEIASAIALGFLLLRSASRLQGHFHERHYRPAEDSLGNRRRPPDDRPLSWWAVRRVSEYSGFVNMYLAGGFGLLYALHTAAEPYWPSWMGHRVFLIFDDMGGIPVLSTSLIVLSAVPAAYQYGLWDSNAQERCRRLELLLLTSLDGEDYWHAATSAAWLRGRGYFVVACILWLAGVVSGKLSPEQGVAALGAGAILWGLYFAVGFRSFSKGMQANSMGLVLTVGLPLLTWGLFVKGLGDWGRLVPPGSVLAACRDVPGIAWLPGPLLGGIIALGIARRAVPRCLDELRHWYDGHHGAPDGG